MRYIIGLSLFIQIFAYNAWSQTNHPGINRFLHSNERIRLGYINRPFDGPTAIELVEGMQIGYEGPKPQEFSKEFKEMLRKIQFAKLEAMGKTMADFVPSDLRNNSLSVEQLTTLQKEIDAIENKISPDEKNKLHFELLSDRMKNEMGLLYMKRERFFILKHGLEATYRYPAELMHFMIANLIVMYGECFGISSSVSFYKASVKDPVCVQNLLEMFTDPMFYGGFYAFMIGNGYATNAVLNSLTAIGKYRTVHSEGKRGPMNMKAANMWAGQIGMAFGFLADQTFHKIFSNHYLGECAKGIVKGLVGGKSSLDEKQMEAEADEVDVAILNDDKRYCIRAYRQLLLSSATRDEMTSGVLGLGISAYLNGLISPFILKGFGHVYNWGARQVGKGAMMSISAATPWYVKKTTMKEVWALSSMVAGGEQELKAMIAAQAQQKTYAVGVKLNRFMGGAGSFLSKTANLAGFLAISKLATLIIDPAVKSVTHTFDFKGDIYDIKEAFRKLEKEERYEEQKCPWQYDEGEVIEATGLCSQIPGVAELREFHSDQQAWRQKKVLADFNIGYHNWQKKWSNFHTHYLATKEIYQQLAQMREFEETTKIQSIEKTISTQNELLDKKYTELAEITGETVESLKSQVLALSKDNEATVPQHLAFMLYLFDSNKHRKANYDALKDHSPLNFRQENDLENIEDLSAIGFFQRMDEIAAALDMAMSEAISHLDEKERNSYYSVKAKVDKYHPSESTVSPGRHRRRLRHLKKLEDKATKYLERIWVEPAGSNTWWGTEQHPYGKSPMDPELKWTFLRAKEVFDEHYREIRLLNNPASHKFRDNADIDLSYALMAFKKLSNLHPITPAKKKLYEVMKLYYPVHKYHTKLNAVQNAYAGLAGYNFDLEGSAVEGSDDPDERPEKFWNKYMSATPEPFLGAPDLYDYVLLNSLCKRRRRYHWTPEKAVINAIGDAVQWILPEPEDEEGFALEFNPPRLTDINYCERVVYLDDWHGQYNMSPKTSIFRSANDKDGYDLWGLAEVAIYEDTIADFMKNEKSFMEWWNKNIFNHIVPKVINTKKGYFEMVETYLLPEYEDKNRGELELAVAGLQTDVEWAPIETPINTVAQIMAMQVMTYPSGSPLLIHNGGKLPDTSKIDDWAYYAARDYLTEQVGSFFSKEVEHRNFKQDENLILAFANEWGILSNYLLGLLTPIAMQAKIVPPSSERPDSSYPAGRPGPFIENLPKQGPPLPGKSTVKPGPWLENAKPRVVAPTPGQSVTLDQLPENFVELKSQNADGQSLSFFVPKEVLENNANFVVDTLVHSIKSIKFGFVNLLLIWDSVENEELYKLTLQTLRASLSSLAQIFVNSERPLRRVKELSKRQDHLILHEGKDNHVPVDSEMAQAILKNKPLFVIIDQLDDILKEIEQLRRQRFAESFNFDKILNDYNAENEK